MAFSVTGGLTNAELRSAPVAVTADGLTDEELRAADLKITLDGESVPVTGIFYPATQPVSLATAPSTPVTGTFFQATQPVSGPLTDAQLRASDVKMTLDGESVLVTGTFYQATQPVSLASMPSTPVTGPLTDAQLRNSAVPVSLATAPTTPVTGIFWQAVQPVSIASMPSTPVTGTFWPATQPVSATALPLPTGAATETTLAALNSLIGAASDTPGAYTVIDRLNQIILKMGKVTDNVAKDATLKSLIALSQKSVSKSYTTLLHRG